MKKIILPSMLVISLIAAAQFSSINWNISNKCKVSTITEVGSLDNLEFEILEEADASFDFEIANYLPIGFDPHNEFAQIYIFEVSVEEDDAPFDFNVETYLPEGFDPYFGIKNIIELVAL